MMLERLRGETLVDTGATFPALPRDIITELAWLNLGEHPAETAEGAGKVELTANATIKIESRVAQSPIIIRPSDITLLTASSLSVLKISEHKNFMNSSIHKLKYAFRVIVMRLT